MSIDEEVGRVAARQHGAFAHWQVREIGGDHRVRRRRVDAGHWEPATSRVLRVRGAPQTAEQRLMISLLHAGPEAVASHESAAWLWGLPGFAECHVVLRPRSHGGCVDQGHRPTLVLPHHRTIVRGIPCTTLARTLFDLAAILPFARMRRLVHTTVTRSPALLPALHGMLEELACKGRTGITTMRQILEELPIGSIPAASGLELRFEEIAWRAGVRGLERQVDVGGHGWIGRSDYRRRDVRLIIEVDSKLHHSSPIDVANDEARDAAMLAEGWAEVLRIYEGDVWHRPSFVAEQLVGTIKRLGGVPGVLGPETDRKVVGFGTENP